MGAIAQDINNGGSNGLPLTYSTLERGSLDLDNPAGQFLDFTNGFGPGSASMLFASSKPPQG